MEISFNYVTSAILQQATTINALFVYFEQRIQFKNSVLTFLSALIDWSKQKHQTGVPAF